MNPELLGQLIEEYVFYARGIANNAQLGDNVKPDMLLKMSQAIAQLVPLTTNDGQAELELKAQEHQMNMTAKQQEMELKAQEHALKLQQSQSDHALKLQQAQDNHHNSLVQSQQNHESKLAQQKEVGKVQVKKNDAK